jgi:hypothetical protein
MLEGKSNPIDNNKGIDISNSNSFKHLLTSLYSPIGKITSAVSGGTLAGWVYWKNISEPLLKIGEPLWQTAQYLYSKIFQYASTSPTETLEVLKKTEESLISQSAYLSSHAYQINGVLDKLHILQNNVQKFVPNWPFNEHEWTGYIKSGIDTVQYNTAVSNLVNKISLDSSEYYNPAHLGLAGIIVLGAVLGFCGFHYGNKLVKWYRNRESVLSNE